MGLKGLGFYIWRIKSLTPLDETIQKLKNLGVSWVSIKFRDGKYVYNRVDSKGNYTGSDDYLTLVVNKLKAAGIEVGGWAFLQSSDMATQASGAVADIKKFGLSHWLVDAENSPLHNAFWKTPQAKSNATAYMNALNVPLGFPVALSSYRFPSYHPEFPFKEFILHPRNTFIAPQMYWMNASNPGQQLRSSYVEYSKIKVLPFSPMGAAYSEYGWSPTAEEIKEFIATSKDMGMQGWGFWELSWALQHEDWLSVIAEEGVDNSEITPIPTPVEPVPVSTPEPETSVIRKLKVSTESVRVRSTIIPSTLYGATIGQTYYPSTVYFSLKRGDIVEVLEEVVDGRNIWVRTGLRQWVARSYDNVTYLV